jgi:hypothetical protein
MPEPSSTTTVAPPVSNAQPSASPSTQAPSAAQPAPSAVAPSPSLVERVASYKPEASAAKPDASPSSEPFFDIKEIEKLADPNAKAVAEKAYKSMQGDYTRKTQALAEERKAAESVRKQYEELSKVNANWTPERIQSLLNDPTFVKAAQQVAGQTPASNQSGLTENEWSALTEKEKAALQQTQQMVQQQQQYLQNLVKQQQDAQLKARYANYDPQALDIITNDVLQGKVQITREHIWKATDYEPAVERAYKLGREDREKELTSKQQEKLNSMSLPSNGSATNGEPVPEKPSGMSDPQYFKMLAQRRLSQSGSLK